MPIESVSADALNQFVRDLHAGRVALCDDDCSVIEPERFREGFKLTDAGRQFLRENPR